MSAHILVIDDERDIRELVRDILVDEGYEVSVAEDAQEARNARRLRRPDLVLMDVWMPDTDGITLLREWTQQEGGFDTPVIMISGHGTVETAVEAIRLGAYDFVEKPLSLSKLLLSVQRALEARKLQRENLDLRRQGHTLVEPIGDSTVMRDLRAQAQRIARHNAWVLITGEPGVGKELLARYLHFSSPRREGPFIEAGIATIAAENAVSALFGAEQGSKVYYGFLEQANSGTLFLGEVGDMDAAVQAKLLGALENRSFVRVGGREPVQFDARVVAATHSDLQAHIAAGRFREDLYYQLNVVPVRVPPLREHSDDVPQLIDYYADLFVRQENLPQRRFSAAAKQRLRAHPWPGNVRELKNLVQRLLILGSGEEISLGEVERALGGRSKQTAGMSINLDEPLRTVRMEFERAYFEHQINVVGGNVSDIAQRAGIERTHFYRKLRMLGIKLKHDL
ncbi:MAG: sigma-54 dependent transcriptional regulator [Chromatiales bacterium]|jgi:DNA-binding NtrC family response regulator|nr:sigma-54 dependent transcriptional regulator [Chromatiales bacterium]